LIINRFKEAKETSIIIIHFKVSLISDGSDPTDYITIPACQEKLRIRVMEEGILFAIEIFQPVNNEMWDPLGIIPVNFPGKLDKSFEVGSVPDGVNVDHG
jgi:hypothetical protein|tara:strand:+ start:234 stop:533 length:300 start_codon:yes stop_codon:yes gene_type:complete